MIQYLLLAFTLMAICHDAQSHPDGAPEKSEVCKHMVPQHGMGPQNSKAPYEVTWSHSSKQRSPNSTHKEETLDVQIKSSQGHFFKGFLIHARHVKTEKMKYEVMGSFEEGKESNNYKVIHCGNFTPKVSRLSTFFSPGYRG